MLNLFQHLKFIYPETSSGLNENSNSLFLKSFTLNVHCKLSIDYCLSGFQVSSRMPACLFS